MKRYPGSIARDQFATARPAKPRTRKARAAIEVLDPAVKDGNWQWEWTPLGAQRTRGWKLATGDAAVLEHLTDRERVAL